MLGKSGEIYRLAFEFCFFLISDSGTLKNFFWMKRRRRTDTLHNYISSTLLRCLHVLLRHAFTISYLFLARFKIWRFVSPHISIFFALNTRSLSAKHPHYTANNFPFMYSQKSFSQVSLLISTKYFQNRIIMFYLELWFCGDVQN